MPFDNAYNRKIAEQENKSNANYATYNAFSNMNYLKQARPDRYDRPPILFAKPREYASQIDYSGGITSKNGEGYGSGIKQLAHLGLGEDTRRFHSKGSGVYGCAKLRDEKDYEMTESESDSESDSESEKSGAGEESEEEEGSGLFDSFKKGAKFVGNLALKHKKEIAKAVAPAALEKLKEKVPAVAKIVEKAKEIPAAKAALAEVGLGKKKRAPSAWVQHCVAFAKSKGMSYRDALRSGECKSSYKKVGKGVVAIEAPETGPAMSDVEGGKRRMRGKKAAAVVHKAYTVPLEVNQNPLIGVPMRKPGFAKHPGVYFEGASLGAGKKRGRPSKKALAAMAEEMDGGAVLGGPINDPVNGKRLGGKSGSAKLGKGIFSLKGSFPLDIKSGVPETEKQVSNDPVDTSIGADKDKAKGLGKKGKGPIFSKNKKNKVKPQSESMYSEPETEDEYSVIDDPNFLEKYNRFCQPPTNIRPILRASKPKNIQPAPKELKPKGSGKRGPSAWIAHVKAYQKQHNVSYKEAMSQAKGSFKKK
jgi:hypothetical protein